MSRAHPATYVVQQGIWNPRESAWHWRDYAAFGTNAEAMKLARLMARHRQGVRVAAVSVLWENPTP